MKSIINLIYLLILSNSSLAQTQYGQREYPNTWELSSGEITKNHIGNEGFIITSAEPTNLSFYSNTIRVDKTSISGNFVYGTSPGISFEREFWLTNLAGQYDIGTVIGTSAIEITQSGNNWYAVAGAYDSGCFIFFLNSFGSVTGFKHFPFSNQSNNYTKPTLIEDQSTNDIYITGSYNSSLYVIKINQFATIQWSSFYDAGGSIFEPRDIIVSPHNGDIIIVGKTTLDSISHPGHDADAFFLSLNPTNGNVNIFVDYTSTPCNWFNSVSPAFSNFGSVGYVVGGYCDASIPGLGSALMMKLDLNGGVIWNTLITGSATNNLAHEIMGVVEKYNPNGTKYYGISKTWNSVSQIFETSVFKLDNQGVPPAGFNEYHYSPPSINDFIPINLVDQPVSGQPDEGLHGFVNYNSNHYLINSYYSGHSGCNESFHFISNIEPGPIDTSFSVVQIGSFNSDNNLQIIEISNSNPPTIYCNSSTVLGGSNIKVTSGIDDLISNDMFMVYPSIGDGKFSVQYYKNGSLEVYDNSGKLILSKELKQEITEIELSNYPNGIYQLNFRDENGMQLCKRIIIDN